ncbi:hypothetical protein A2U01_0092513 [Trifolium medium]|uniref:Uncharacterized protein n=1 Tax=Trifolium medium TaxID=97028 RepID=A0A392UFN0_9FABA|nr:hypothetical protein [Trifolium medium]
MVAMMISGKISYGDPPTHSPLLNPKIGLPDFLDDDDSNLASTEHISILRFLVLMDIPLRYESPP